MARCTRNWGKESYWRTAVARWRRSGLSVRAFCREEGISEPNFYAWRRKLDRARHEGPAFLPVRVVVDQADPAVDRRIEIVLGNGRCLRVERGFDPQTLTQVIDLLEVGGSSC